MKNSQVDRHYDHHDPDTSHLPALGAKLGPKCNFCDSIAGLELHHIIPRSLGGTDGANNLITVCNDHHAILHGMKQRGNISALTKNGLAKAKSRGVVLGNPTNLATASGLGAKANSAKADAFAEQMRVTISRMLDSGMSFRNIAAELNANGTRTARNGLWAAGTISRIVTRIGK